MPAQGPDGIESIDEVVARLGDEVTRRLLVSSRSGTEDVMRFVWLLPETASGSPC